MAYNCKKTDHDGPKRGAGAFRGRRADAKVAASRRRRQDGRNEAAKGLAEQGNAQEGVPKPF
ncbi:MAG: hypothetical protein WC107_04265 [Patescibacteria group bacterium]